MLETAFLLTLAFGLAIYVIRIVFNLATSKVSNKILLGVKDALFMIVLFVGLIVSIVMINNGVLRYYIVLAYFLGIFIANRFYNLLLAKFFQKLYNLIRKKNSL